MAINTTADRFRFVKLTQAQYAALGDDLGTTYADYLFFTTDTKKIYKGADCLTDAIAAVTNHSTLTSMTKVTGRFYVEADTKDVYYYDGTNLVFITGIYSDGAADALSAAVIAQTTPGTYDDTAAGVETTSARQVVTYVEGVKEALTQLINSVSAGVNSAVHAPVQDETALAAINLTSDGVLDKTICLVEDSSALYRYDAQSSAAAAAGKVVAPGNSQTGRWIKILTAADVVLTDILATTEAPASLGTAPAVGTSTKAARADHVHDYTSILAVANTNNPATLGGSGTVASGKIGSNAVGSSNKVARADHTHELDLSAYYATGTPEAVGAATGTVTNGTLGTAAAGTSQQFAKADHVHQLNLTPYYATTAPVVADEAAVGTSQQFAKADHVHPSENVWYTVAA